MLTVTTILLGIIGLIGSAYLLFEMKKKALGFTCGGFSLLVITLSYFIVTVPSGHVKVAALFGKVQVPEYKEGLHIINPFYSFEKFDTRQKTFSAKNIGIPSEDKLITSMDVSVQYRTIASMTPDILKNTGSTEQIISVHLVPKLRSILREQGKGIAQAQDFFKESVQSRLQVTLQEGLSSYLISKGLQVETVLIRDIRLPKVINDSITETKRREQEVLKQKAELERFATEQNQKVKQAESEFEAAKLEAKKIKELASAEAFKINVINKTLAQSPNYIELKRVEQWNGVLPVYTGGESVPMIDLR